MSDIEEAMLAQKATTTDLERLLNDDQWAVEQKIDGIRMMIQVMDREALAFNRNGEPIDLPWGIAANFDNSGFNGRWVFDGEFLDHTYYLFDILDSGNAGVRCKAPYVARRSFLEKLMGRWNTINIVLIPSVEGKDKLEFFSRIQSSRAEGVVFKNKKGPYEPGKRSNNILKFKFVETVDVIVAGLERKGKPQAIDIELFHNGKRIPAGGCKIPEKYVGLLQVDDVIECQYLYATVDNKLYQPSFIKLRTDKKPEQCTTDQLKPTNKEVLKQ